MPYNDDINDPDYSIFNAYYFFIGGDNTRLIILIYIFLCIALNILIYIAIFLSKKKLSFVSKITLSIMGVNLIHTFVYSYEWVFKIENKTISIGDQKDIIVGFLLTGNPNNMGAVMAPAAASTIYNHFKELKLKENYYDLILTGDLGIYGKEILKEYMKKEYNFNLNDYNDCGTMLYKKNQKEILAGGSGPVCSALVNYGYIYELLKAKKLKRVLLVTTGALFSPTFLFQKQNIYSIAHAISLEAL